MASEKQLCEIRVERGLPESNCVKLRLLARRDSVLYCVTGSLAKFQRYSARYTRRYGDGDLCKSFGVPVRAEVSSCCIHSELLLQVSSCCIHSELCAA